jgi:hypothetical protein
MVADNRAKANPIPPSSELRQNARSGLLDGAKNTRYIDGRRMCGVVVEVPPFEDPDLIRELLDVFRAQGVLAVFRYGGWNQAD